MFRSLHSTYEMAERELLTHYLKAGDRVVEIGAGIGYLCLVAKTTCGVEHYAMVEGNPALAPLIRKNMEINGLPESSYELYSEIVSDAVLRANFVINKDFWVSRIVAGRDDGVRTLSTQRLLARIHFQPNTLILDIEGGEADIDFASFSNFDKIMIEMHPQFIGHERCCSIIDGIIGRGFRLRDYRATTFYFDRRQ